MKAKIIKISTCVALLAFFLYNTSQFEKEAHQQEVDDPGYFCKAKAHEIYGEYNFEKRTLSLQQRHIRSFPKYHFEKIRCVRTLNLNNNSFTKIPKTNLEGLEILSMVYNKVKKLDWTRFPESKALKKLYLSHNRIKTINLNGFYDLNLLDVSNNRISRIKRITKTSIQNIKLTHNTLKLFPYQFKNIQNLNTLDLSNNKLYTIVNNDANDLAQFKYLQKLSLENNALLEFPTALGKMPQLEILELDKNEITGTVKIKGFNTLKELKLYNQNATSFVIEANSAKNLKKISLVNNQISTFNIKAPLPKCLDLTLYSNAISVLPKSIFQLTNLENLDLSKNIFKAIPNLKAFKHLKKLTFDDNNFTSLEGAELPTSLERLDLSNSYRLKDIPLSVLKSLPNLKKLILYHPISMSDNEISKIKSYCEQRQPKIKLVL